MAATLVLGIAIVNHAASAPVWSFTTISNAPSDAHGLRCNDQCTVGRKGVSADKDVVVFTAFASNLAVDDRNGRGDVYVRRRSTNTTTRLTRTSAVGVLEGGGWSAQVTADGTLVAFLSTSGDFVSGDANGNPDVFVANTSTGEIRAASTRNDGTFISSGPTDYDLATNGSALAFVANGNYIDGVIRSQVYVRDLVSNTLELASTGPAGAGDADTYFARISSDGRYVAFITLAGNLVTPAPANRSVYLRDRQLGTTRVVTTGAPGGRLAIIGVTNGRVIVQNDALAGAFRTDICEFYSIDIATLVATKIPVAPDPAAVGQCTGMDVSDDAARVLFNTSEHLGPGHVFDRRELYVVDATNGAVTQVTNGGHLDASAQYAGFVPQGHDVAFSSKAPALVAGDANRSEDGFLRGTDGTTQLLTLAGPIANPAGGRGSAAFESSADSRFALYVTTDLAPFVQPDDLSGSTALVLLDRQSGTRTLVNRVGDTIINGFMGSVSDEGETVVFVGIENGGSQIYRFDSASASTTPVLAPGQANDGGILALDLAADGSTLAFATQQERYNGPPDGSTTLVHLTLAGGATQTITKTQASTVTNLRLSSDGSSVVFSTSDGNDADVFRWTRASGQVTALPGYDGTPGAGLSMDLGVSRNGRYATWRTKAPADQTRGQRILFDFETLTSRRCPAVEALGFGSRAFDVSNDGRWLVFASPAPSGSQPVSPVFGDEIYIYSVQEDALDIVTRHENGRPSGAMSQLPRVSADGATVLFGTYAPYLAPDELEPNAHDVLVAVRSPVAPLLTDGFE